MISVYLCRSSFVNAASLDLVQRAAVLLINSAWPPQYCLVHHHGDELADSYEVYFYKILAI